MQSRIKHPTVDPGFDTSGGPPSPPATAVTQPASRATFWMLLSVLPFLGVLRYRRQWVAKRLLSTHQRRHFCACASSGQPVPQTAVGSRVRLLSSGATCTLVSKGKGGWWELQMPDGTRKKVRTGQFVVEGMQSPEATDDDVRPGTELGLGLGLGLDPGVGPGKVEGADGGARDDLVAPYAPDADALDSPDMAGACPNLSDSESPSISVTVHTLAASQAHESIAEWVVFSDLHVTSSSLGTCLEVLQKVHATAVERGAGVLFLGDFWHLRGSLRVDILNSVMAELAKWTVPVVMVPGNHDQVLRGTGGRSAWLANAADLYWQRVSWMSQ